jgi:hypothetical protein
MVKKDADLKVAHCEDSRRLFRVDGQHQRDSSSRARRPDKKRDVPTTDSMGPKQSNHNTRGELTQSSDGVEETNRARSLIFGHNVAYERLRHALG